MHKLDFLIINNYCLVLINEDIAYCDQIFFSSKLNKRNKIEVYKCDWYDMTRIVFRNHGFMVQKILQDFGPSNSIFKKSNNKQWSGVDFTLNDE